MSGYQQTIISYHFILGGDMSVGGCEYMSICWKKVCVCVRVCADLLGLCSCHSNNAADALSDGLL